LFLDAIDQWCIGDGDQSTTISKLKLVITNQLCKQDHMPNKICYAWPRPYQMPQDCILVCPV